jgi:hypothetical protein
MTLMMILGPEQKFSRSMPLPCLSFANHDDRIISNSEGILLTKTFSSSIPRVDYDKDNQSPSISPALTKSREYLPLEHPTFARQSCETQITTPNFENSSIFLK